MNQLDRLIGDLERVPWDSPCGAVHPQVEAMIGRVFATNRSGLLEALDQHLRSRACTLTVTAGLHSWMLHDPGRWILKLNQFKPQGRNALEPEGIHNHMRPFTSLTLCGSYVQDFYFPDREYADGESWDWLSSVPGPSPRRGHVYTMAPSTWHYLKGYEDDTLTLVAYGRQVRPAISRFDPVRKVHEVWGKHSAAKEVVLDRLARAA